MIARRSFLTGLAAAFAAPAIVKASSLMPVRGVIIPQISRRWLVDYDIGRDAYVVRYDVSNGRLVLPTPEHTVKLLDERAVEVLTRAYGNQINAADTLVADANYNRQLSCWFELPSGELDRALGRVGLVPGLKQRLLPHG